VATFTSGDLSELSDEDYDPDARLAKYPSVMAPVAGRSHVIGLDEAIDQEGLRYLLSGLHFSDTYLALFKEGRLVPRYINEKENSGGHRKPMGRVAEVLKKHLAERDRLLQALDAWNAQLQDKPSNMKAVEAERDAVYRELVALLVTEIRPPIEDLLFSSSGYGPTAEDLEKTGAAAEQRGQIRGLLARDPGVSGEAIRQRPPAGITTGSDSGSHAEQKLINTRTWGGLVDTLVKAIATQKDAPETIAEVSHTTLQLVINRSTCIGCARELIAELIRFWQTVAAMTGMEDWRRAKYVFEDYVQFLVDFPAIYEENKERDSEYQNFDRIVLGLRDAGWRVRIIEGISGTEASNKKNQEARDRVNALSDIPMFFVPDWNPSLAAFAVPEALKPALEKHEMVMINGIRYWLTPDGQTLTRSDSETKPQIDASASGKFQYLKTGGFGVPGTSGGRKPTMKRARSETETDPELQALRSTGAQIVDVPGWGMNCLIRALFTAAGITFDEAMVKIVRNLLIENGFTERREMLDLLGDQGAALITLLQQQRVLPQNLGLTVFFDGGKIEALEGTHMVYLWFGNAHFQAVIRK